MSSNMLHEFAKIFANLQLDLRILRSKTLYWSGCFQHSRVSGEGRRNAVALCIPSTALSRLGKRVKDFLR